MSDPKSTQTVAFYIRRYNPDLAPEPHWQEFPVRVHTGMTVLDGLHQIKAEQDPTLAVRYSCRMGVCGSCGMLLNGVPRLACNTQILHIASDRLTLASLPNFAIIKDLVPDLRPLIDKHVSIHPHIIRTDDAEMLNPSGELYQRPDELLEYLQFTFCIKCGLCMAACPTLATDPQYLGPQPLAQAHRYNADSRDGGYLLRRELVGGGAHGAFRCHYAGECSNVCPKGVDPARAIQKLKRDLVFDYLRLKRRHSPSQVIQYDPHAPRQEPIKAPDRTI